ncbi:MAG: hypothetical protein U1D30_04340 [Planctomycetota bacterium]
MAIYRTFRDGKRSLLAIAAILLFNATAFATDLSGDWKRHWESCTTGHKGPLKASFCKLDDATYEVTFKGRFFIVLPFKYSVTLNVVSDDGQTVTLAGESYLGRRYGTFTYNATATDTEFVANYTSCKDEGKFILCREVPPCGCP